MSAWRSCCWVGHRAVTLRLALELAEQFPLTRYLHDLVEHHTVGMGHFGEKRQYIGGYRIAVYVCLGIWLHHRGQVYLVYIHQRIRADYAVSCSEVFVGSLKIGHGEGPVPEMEGHESVYILGDLRL